MNLFDTLDINIYSISVLLVLYISIIIKKHHLTISNNFFMSLIFSTIFILVLEALSWIFDGGTTKSDYLYNKIFNFIFITFNPIVPIMWLNYIDYKLFSSVKRLKRRFYYSWFLIISLIIMIINLNTGIIYGISSDNKYYRGPYMIHFTIYLFSILIFSIIPLLKKRKELDSSVYISYGLFTILPILGAYLQIIFFGELLVWNFVALAVFGTYMVLELRNISKDYLTGLATRREAEVWIKHRIGGSSKKSFAVIMIDLNGFKKINDTYGHKEGDYALKIFSNIIGPAFKKNDVIGRYGGDEFIILIDSDYRFIVDKSIQRIHQLMNEFNNKNIKPYKIKFSAGGVLYNPKIHNDYKDIIHHADSLMYIVKKG